MQFGLSASLFDAAYKHFIAGRVGEAEQTVRQALGLDPRHADSLHLLGVIAGFTGHPEESLQLCELALAERPDFASAHANRGVALMALGRHDDSLASFRRAVEIDPKHVHGWFGLGNALGVRKDMGGAEEAFRQAVALSPGHFEARSNLGHALQMQGRLDEAIETFSEALAGAPPSAELEYNLGVALQLAARVEEALPHYRRALELQPSHAKAHSNVLLALNYLPGIGAERMLEEHRAFDALQARPLAPVQPSWPNTRDPDRRLRIGYVSGDFHSHPVGHYLVGPLEAHDRAGFEVFCYSNDDQEDHVTGRIANAIDHWRDIAGLGDERAAGLVQHDRIDILVDLSGHTNKNRPLLFARKPAPVQVSWLGYPGSTGMSAVDYLVMDAHVLPPGADWSVEQVVRLPHGRFCYSPPPYMPEVAGTPFRREGEVVFGSFNNLAKVGPDVVRLWARMLDAVPGARLVLKSAQLAQPSIRQRFAEAFAAAGVGPDRLDLRRSSPHEAMLAEYADIDVALDPFPFGGGLTSSEALWMGVPVVTLPMDSVASRQTLAFLAEIGLSDLAAASEDDYVRIAAALAGDPARRAELRKTLRPMMTAAPMNDPKAFAAALDAAYRQMWKRWCAGLPAAEITV